MSRNRQIKIRIWDKQNKKWLVRGVDVLSEAMLFSLTRIEDYSNFEISQSTGLTDQHGREIWEGDYFLNGSDIYTIRYSMGRFWAEYEACYTYIDELYNIIKIGDNCVLGNVYEDDYQDLWSLTPYIIDESRFNDAQKKEIAENTIWNDDKKIFRLIKGKTFRLIEMKVTERSKFYGQDNDYRSAKFLEESRRIYSQNRYYLAVPPEWYANTRPRESYYQDYRFNNQAKDKIYTTILKGLWTLRGEELNKSFFAQTNEGQRFFQIETSQVEPETVTGTDINPSLYIFLKDYTFKTPSLFDTHEFLRKGNFIK